MSRCDSFSLFWFLKRERWCYAASPGASIFPPLSLSLTVFLLPSLYSAPLSCPESRTQSIYTDFMNQNQKYQMILILQKQEDNSIITTYYWYHHEVIYDKIISTLLWYIWSLSKAVLMAWCRIFLKTPNTLVNLLNYMGMFWLLMVIMTTGVHVHTCIQVTLCSREQIQWVMSLPPEYSDWTMVNSNPCRC